MHRFILALCALGLLLTALPSQAFFEEIDTLEERVTGGRASTAGDTTVQNLIETLDRGSGPVFRDVDQNAWYAAAVNAAAKQGLIHGDRDAKTGALRGTFRPGDRVTVAEMLRIAYNAWYTTGIITEPCPDTLKNNRAATHWAKTDFACAEAWQVRVALTLPDPDRPATRAEAVAILTDVFQRQLPSYAAPFTDTAGHAYETDIAAAAYLGIVTGDTKDGTAVGTFRPDDTLNRAEAAAVAVRTLSPYFNNPTPTPYFNNPTPTP